MGYSRAVAARSFDSAVVGSMIAATSNTRSAGKPPRRACSRISSALGRLPLARRAQELDPLAHRNDLTTMLLRAGRYDQALSQAKDSAEVDPRGPRARATLGWAYFFNGRREEGVAELESAVALSARNSLWLGQLGQAYAMTGETSKARAIVRELEERAQQTFVSPYHLAYVYTGLGDAERAMDLLERAVADRTGATYSIKGSFLFAPLRGHPRFHELMRTMNLGSGATV